MCMCVPFVLLHLKRHSGSVNIVHHKRGMCVRLLRMCTMCVLEMWWSEFRFFWQSWNSKCLTVHVFSFAENKEIRTNTRSSERKGADVSAFEVGSESWSVNYCIGAKWIISYSIDTKQNASEQCCSYIQSIKMNDEWYQIRYPYLFT